jgi:orotate phosphoribosyltransferase
MSILDLTNAREGHFVLESGFHGSLWLDLEPIFLEPDRLRPYLTDLAAKIAEHQPQAVCGPLMGGAFLAQGLASYLGVAFYYTERIAASEDGLFKTQYRLPPALHESIAGKRVAVVDDAISAGSSVRATLTELKAHGAEVVVIGSLLMMGTIGLDYFTGQNLPVRSLLQLPYAAWAPAECPMCAAGKPFDAA